MIENCKHKGALDIVETLDSFRAHIDQINTVNRYFPSAYYRVNVYRLRCKCGEEVINIHPQYWSSKHYASPINFIDDAERDLMMVQLHTKIRRKYADRLRKAGMNISTTD